MAPDLGTTNALLGIMAAVSILEALVIVGVLVGGVVLYRRLIQAIARIEERQIGPAVARVNAILDDVHGLTSVIRGAADSADAQMRRGLACLRRFRMRRRAA